MNFRYITGIPVLQYNYSLLVTVFIKKLMLKNQQTLLEIACLLMYLYPIFG
jgi:hypothetical protein